MNLGGLKEMLALHQTPFDMLDFSRLEKQLYNVLLSPAARVLEEENSYIVQLELPGVDKDSIKVKATDRTLNISAERTEPKDSKKDELVSEFRYGTWSRTLHFQNGLNRDCLKATYKDGVLEVIANKAQTHTEVTVKVED
tara:strand:+ start:311 stop:730 length:420 start_codon:yes stop_codon:yes gene_type:complete